VLAVECNALHIWTIYLTLLLWVGLQGGGDTGSPRPLPGMALMGIFPASDCRSHEGRSASEKNCCHYLAFDGGRRQSAIHTRETCSTERIRAAMSSWATPSFQELPPGVSRARCMPTLAFRATRHALLAAPVRQFVPFAMLSQL
jgi:hypothetical protein